MTPSGPAAGMSGVARGSALNLVGSAVAVLCSFGIVAVIARGLDRVHAGIFFSTTSLFLVATSLGGLGTTVGLVYFLSSARASGRPDLVMSYLQAAIRPVVAIGLTMSIGMLVFAPWIARATNPGHADIATGYLLVLAPFVVPTVTSTALLAATRGLGIMRSYVLVEQIGRQLLQVTLVALATAVSGRFIAWAWALPYLAAVTASLLVWRSLRTAGRTHDHRGVLARALRPADPEIRKGFWRFTRPRALGSVVSLLIQRIDIVLVGAFAGPVQAAIYAAATRFVVAGQFGSAAVTTALQPALAASLAQRDHATTTSLFRTSGGWIVTITWPLYLTFCVSGSVLLQLFGSGYGSGATVLALVAGGLLFGSACGDVDSLLTMSGRSMASLGNAVLALGVMIGLDVWLIPQHGALGAAIGWAGAIIARNAAGVVQAWRAERVHVLGPELLLAVALSATCFGAVEWVLLHLFGGGVLAFVLALAISGIVYLAGLWLLRRRLHLDQFGALRRRRRAGPSGQAGQSGQSETR